MFLIKEGPEIDLNADLLMQEAERRTGLSDWGDTRFVAALQALVTSFVVDAMPKYNTSTRASIGRSLVEVLVNRLLVLEDRKRYPQIAKVRIEKPIFFIGMGRTGSTFIQTLFAQDPANLSPELWETILPSPPPRFGMGEQRRERVAQIWRWYMQDMAGIESQHPYFIEDSYRALAECGSIGQISFSSYHYFSYFGTSSYWKWFMEADQSEAVDFHHKFLQHLQWGREGRTWVSKAVEHGVYLQALLLRYPDGYFVWTHRDPLAQASSLASILGTIRARCGDLGGSGVLGATALDSIKQTLNRGMEIRRAAGEERFIDVYYPRFVSNPIGTIREIYEKMGRSLTAEAELNMNRWLRNNQADRAGVHKYSAAAFGITDELVRRELHDYLDWFGRELESSRRQPIAAS
ncbi:hypothetical protein ACG33_10605 [Steroidobacter denitrificans]|uniref:Sulfotransferase n=1 Tax=Steroidobacter denitrificans TaxID=465721 RepID=A0A127FCY1_STEDE|nr:sulfotransferase [Steroidobacter denitrificans]AMN47540.1 hypothetical protein ACG33_10605 [Steroidobacter denitrificans]